MHNVSIQLMKYCFSNQRVATTKYRQKYTGSDLLVFFSRDLHAWFEDTVYCMKENIPIDTTCYDAWKELLLDHPVDQEMIKKFLEEIMSVYITQINIPDPTELAKFFEFVIQQKLNKGW